MAVITGPPSGAQTLINENTQSSSCPGSVEMVISPVIPSDASLYTCVTGSEELLTHVQLHVHSKPTLTTCVKPTDRVHVVSYGLRHLRTVVHKLC